MKQDKQSLDQFATLLKFDSRVIAHNKRNGILNDVEAKEYVSSLPDSASNLERMEIDDINLNGAAS